MTMTGGSTQWLKELPKEDIVKHLDKDALLIAETCGIDVLLALWNAGRAGTLFYLNSKPIRSLRGMYIKRQYDMNVTIKQIARNLDISEKTVYRYLHNYKTKR